MPPSLHAILGASSAHRWLACPPSARLSERLDSRFGRKESEFAKEGTKAHALGELKIRHEFYKMGGMTTEILSRMTAEERESYLGINDFRYKSLREELGDIPADMEKATDSYCDVVVDKYIRAKDTDSSAQLFLEQKLDYSKWVPSGFGTGDCIIVSDSLLEICDYKHGVGIPVSAVNNPQLRLYALGAIDQFDLLYDFTAVRMTIIQPRLDNVSEETITIEELKQWAEREVVEKAKLAWLGKGEFQSGEHCRFCSAKAICAKRVSDAMKMFDYGFEQAGIIPEEQIPEILKVADLAESWLKDIRAYAETQALNGQRYPGFKLVRGKKTNRKWSDPEEVKAQLLRAGYAPDQIEATQLKTVGEIEKTIGKPAFAALVGGLVQQGDGKIILVPEDDKRPEYSQADSAYDDILQDFNGGN